MFYSSTIFASENGEGLSAN